MENNSIYIMYIEKRRRKKKVGVLTHRKPGEPLERGHLFFGKRKFHRKNTLTGKKAGQLIW
jgi:hypothetical protein